MHSNLCFQTNSGRVVRTCRASRRCRPVVAALPGFSLSQLLSQLPGQRLQLEDSEPGLSSWLQQRGFATAGQKVVAQNLEGQGRGLVAAAAVQAGELLLTVPESLIIFPQTAAQESLLAPLLSQETSELPDWSLLVLFLAEQLFLTERQAISSSSSGSSSRWGPYVQMLPKRPIGTVLDWTPKEVEVLLAGSGLLPKAATIISAAQLLWQDLQPLITAAKQQALCPADMFSKADIDWAVGICLSRSVRLDDRGGEVVLVPFADLFNHDPACSAFLVWDEQQQGVVLRPDRAYKPGEQVFISYGPKSSGELLLSYGFCPPPGSNPHDSASLTFSLQPTDPWLAAKQQALAARGIPSSESFAVRIDSLPAGLLPYVAFCSAKCQSEAQVEQLAAGLFDSGDLPDLNGVSCEQIALEAVAKKCKAALQGYPQKQEADRQLAAGVPNGGGYEQRAALMAAVRVRERQILSRTEFVCQQRVRQLRKGA